MGRQKGRHLHVIAKKLVDEKPELFSTDFNLNKEQVSKLGIFSDSHQERNKLAGEITKLVKRTRGEEQAQEKQTREKQTREEKHALTLSPASQA